MPPQHPFVSSVTSNKALRELVAEAKAEVMEEIDPQKPRLPHYLALPRIQALTQDSGLENSPCSLLFKELWGLDKRGGEGH